MKGNYMIYWLLFLSLFYAHPNIFQEQTLSENALYSIPEEMTLEEYDDMNKHLNVAILYSTTGIPGIVHSYAGEKNTAKKIRWATAGGVLSVIGGSMLSKEDGWQDSDYATIDIDGIRYEKIPSWEDESGTFYYDYKQLEKKYTGGEGLMILGVGVIFVSYFYDFFHGIKVIEEKRNKVRFKYGKMLNLGFEPTYNLDKKEVGFNLSYKF